MFSEAAVARAVDSARLSCPAMVGHSRWPDAWITPSVDFRTPDGLSVREAEEAIQMVAAHFRLKAAALTAYNPNHEENDRTLQTGLHLLNVLAGAVGNGKE